MPSQLRYLAALHHLGPPRMSTPFDPHAFLRTKTFVKRIHWVKNWGDRVYVDPQLVKYMGQRVYRYVPPMVEALPLLERNQMRFDHPSIWAKKGDKFEAFVADHLFGAGAPFDRMAVYAKCFTFHYASEAFWRINSGRVRLTFSSLAELVRNLGQATLLKNAGPSPKLFVARVRYMEPRVIHEAIRQVLREQPAKRVSSLAAPAILMKRMGFGHENEVRIFFIRDGEIGDGFMDVRLPGWPPLDKEALIDPYISDVDEIRKIKNALSPYIPVKQSGFDLEPTLRL